ncbi:MAG: ATP-binding protein, partial [Bdellovibrionota bacterium]|nr:ATP-binding protein [Bdellovibrionota bacterium]
KLENTDCSFKIELSDDGFGIDTSKIYEKAVYSGLIKNEELNHQEKLNLIFHPLLSSKDDADELSGRGIGMDAVKNLIQSIGGEIKVFSTPLKGTKFEIIIP